mmetsp:Transcript_13601/g.21248  ORF Transcript_13601/g.21248 Transcript_13601/m.21248 type:complete len:270 (-) Transcript_13601:47-856(-)|eukprot:CAMPEP_0184310088 /NCGR_PEP_ID=MMETSP1049-20130417/23653_1 /TAXON_ID=77928 /ORGANISM="Proteomonas sulcata, Strain CCMP704" /LENGTH=269 /DNA_ID=CAMNT_0026623611 /DNA_START=783 /DNA_END=1592 /DNA_ORIENTATION=+
MSIISGESPSGILHQVFGEIANVLNIEKLLKGDVPDYTENSESKANPGKRKAIFSPTHQKKLTRTKSSTPRLSGSKRKLAVVTELEDSVSVTCSSVTKTRSISSVGPLDEVNNNASPKLPWVSQVESFHDLVAGARSAGSERSLAERLMIIRKDRAAWDERRRQIEGGKVYIVSKGRRGRQVLCRTREHKPTNLAGHKPRCKCSRCQLAKGGLHEPRVTKNNHSPGCACQACETLRDKFVEFLQEAHHADFDGPSFGKPLTQLLRESGC